MPERYHCLTVKAVFNKVFISRLAVCTIDGKVKIQEFKRNNIPKYTGLVSFLSKWGGRPLADWGPNSFGDNLIWVGRRWQGQIWKSFKYVDRHLDLGQTPLSLKVKLGGEIFYQKIWGDTSQVVLYFHIFIMLKPFCKIMKQFPFFAVLQVIQLVLTDVCQEGGGGGWLSDNRKEDIEVNVIILTYQNTKCCGIFSPLLGWLKYDIQYTPCSRECNCK